MAKTSRRKLTFSPSDAITTLFTNDKEHPIFKEIQAKYGVELKINQLGILIAKGDKDKTLELERKFKAITEPTIENLRAILNEENTIESTAPTNDIDPNHLEFKGHNGKSIIIKPKNEHQRELIECILKNKVTLALGSAGTGKSLISLAVGLKLLESKKIQKIIITKPPIDAGPQIGFLPGDESSKLGPYILSVMGLLTELIGSDKRDKLLKDGAIEIQNLGYLRGMTLGAEKRGGVLFLLDEAQNVDFYQNKMILSRLGDHKESRIVYAGDQLQSDLKNKKDTLSLIHSIIKDSPYVGSVLFTRSDICRSPTVRDLMERIELWEEKQASKKP